MPLDDPSLAKLPQLRQPTPQSKLSVNALLVSPLRLRWLALIGLWRFRGCWRLPLIRQHIRGETLRELEETMPIVLILALVAASMIFIALPAALREQSSSILTTLWPIWVQQLAPMLCALVLCMLNAPAVALRFVELHASHAFSDQNSVRVQWVAALAWPQIFAHALVCAACTSLLLAFTLIFGVLAELVLAVGDLRRVLDSVLASTSPLAWLRAIGLAALLGAGCALAAILYAWPGSQQISQAKDTHRVGVFAVIASAVACTACALAMSWLASLLGWTPEV